MKRLFLIFTIITGLTATIHATNPHFYHRFEINTGNLYSFTVTNLLTAGLNKASNDRLFDNSFNYTIYNCDAPDYKVKEYDRIGVSFRDLFADSNIGVKLGYQSFNMGFFNWGIYGSAHYRINQFKTVASDATMRHNIQRIQLGGGLMIAFGSMDNENKVILEGSLRYNLPAYYHISGINDNQKSLLDNGLTSYYAIRMGGLGPLKGLGVFIEIPHYSMIKSDVYKIKPYTFGLTYTIMPWDM